jgi:hypothetical protein
LDSSITVVKVKNEDYISLTDMLKSKNGNFFISEWLRNRNTLEYLGIWEKIIIQILIMANSPQLHHKLKGYKN